MLTAAGGTIDSSGRRLGSAKCLIRILERPVRAVSRCADKGLRKWQSGKWQLTEGGKPQMGGGG